MDPATISAIMTVLGPIMQGVMGQGGQMGSTFNPQQQNFMQQGLSGLNPSMGNIQGNQGYQQGQEWLNSLFNDPEFFKSFEAPLQREFSEKTIPELATRFGSMGSGGSLGSTAFRNALGRESSTLHEKIASLRGGLQQQGVNQQLQYSQQPVSNYLQQLQQLLTPTQNLYLQGTF